MDELAKLICEDLGSPRRCFFHGTTSLGGTDACRPELQDDGSVILRSLNLTHVAYRVTADEYREIRKYPKRKVGMWDFVDDDDPDADRIASATRNPQYAGRRIGDLERAIAAKDAEIANLTAALTGKFCVCFMDGINDHGTHVLPSFPRSVDCDFDVLEQAQAIWAAGEIEGFQAGDHIWCEFAFHPAQTGEYGQVEVASYWEFTRVDAGLSRAINAAALKEQADA